jgi:AraC family transcriptional regulator, regulatory protein of adaptative response / methylated-DNA-[protein]-cysteine methyltransferase
MDGTMIETPKFDDDETRWQAIRSRDRTAEGRFFYAVITTGVFCRVTCPSRLPRRENVAFFATPEAAGKAGYRPCKRCRPTGRSVEQAQLAAIRQACALIDEAETPPPLKDLAEAVSLSPFHFHRLFKEIVGVTPKAYAAAKRVGRVQDELAAGAPVAEALYGAGYGSSSRLYENARATLGMTPAAFRKGGAGSEIRWSIAATPLGRLIVAATPDGICMIEFGDDEAELEARLQARFPQAETLRADAELAAHVAAVTAFVELPARGLNLPLDIQGTAFQRRVWQILQAIPAGETASYGEVARRLGEPKAVRAVARACATNGIALAIPCHRVIGSVGAVTGYRWGVERKRALLDREKVSR